MKTIANRGYHLQEADTILDHADNHSYTLRVRDRAAEDKPRERMMTSGSTGLTIAELVAIIWGTGTRKEEVMEMASRLTREYGEASLQHETNPKRLVDLLDIPIGKACQVVASLEIGRRFYQRKNTLPVYVRTAEQAYEYMKAIATTQKEQLRGIYLNSRYQVIHEEVVSVGSLTASIIHPREVFQPAIERGAAAVIVAHNHPSGDARPTVEDRQVTMMLCQAGELLGIELLDHLIIVKEGYHSIMEDKK